MLNWLRKLPIQDWIKAGVIGTMITYFVFSLLPAFLNFSLGMTTLWNWLDFLATPIITGWLTILVYNSPYRKAFTKGILAGLVCSIGRLVPFGITFATNPSMVAEVASGFSFLIASDLVRMAFTSFVSGIISRVLARRQPDYNTVSTEPANKQSRLNLVVTRYVTAVQSGNTSELKKILGQRVSCNKCGTSMFIRDAWQDGNLVCPVCKEVWVKMA